MKKIAEVKPVLFEEPAKFLISSSEMEREGNVLGIIDEVHRLVVIPMGDDNGNEWDELWSVENYYIKTNPKVDK